MFYAYLVVCEHVALTRREFERTRNDVDMAAREEGWSVPFALGHGHGPGHGGGHGDGHGDGDGHGHGNGQHDSHPSTTLMRGKSPRQAPHAQQHALAQQYDLSASASHVDPFRPHTVETSIQPQHTPPLPPSPLQPQLPQSVKTGYGTQVSDPGPAELDRHPSIPAPAYEAIGTLPTQQLAAISEGGKGR